jgi:oligopeptidase A
VRQIEFSLFDLLLHSDADTNAARDVPIEQVLALLDEVRREVAVLFPPVWHRFPHSFSHIFAGGYAAGYYSYKWAEVLSADAFAAFEEAAGEGNQKRSLLDPATGERFWREILAVGSSRPAIESFIAFRGRAPTVDALLRHSGMARDPSK